MTRFSKKQAAVLACALLAAATFLIYWHSLGNGFVIWDDDMLVYKNPLVLHFSLYSLWAVFTSYDPELYIPLTFLSYQIEHLLFGLNPAIYHLTNLLLHTGSAILLFFLLQRWRLSREVAFVLALLFAIHPLNSEAVVWVSARKDTLSSFLFLATLLSWERFREKGTRRTYILSLILFLLALLAKVSVVLLPFVLLLTDWRDRRPMDQKTILEKVPFFLLSIAFVIVALFGKTGNIAAVTPWETILLAGKAIVFYLQMYSFPLRLSSIYHQNTPITLASPEFFVPLLLLLLLGIAVLWSLRKTRTIAFGTILFLMLLIPAFANFSKVGSVYYASDRYIYMSQIGILYLLGVGWMHLRQTHWARTGALIAFALLLVFLPAYAWASYQRSVVWGDSERLFRDAMEKNPESEVIRFNLAVVEHQRGDYVEAMQLYESVLAIQPDFSQAYNNAGLIYRDQGDRVKAEEWFRKAVELDPHNLSALINVATMHLDRDEPDPAIVLLRRAIMEDPYNVPALSKMGAAYGKKGMYREGLEWFQKAWRLDPEKHAESKELERLLRQLEN